MANTPSKAARDRAWKNWKADQDDLEPRRYWYVLGANHLEPEVD